MSKSRRSSTPSLACRIDVRPSPALVACLLAMGLLGAVSFFMSNASVSLASIGAAAWSLASGVYARREIARTPYSIVLSGDGSARVDGRDVDGFTIDWRGPFYLMAWTAGERASRWLAFPDVLDVATRRDLRLWAARWRERGPTAAVAP